ncbi:MAG TPA: hemolysin family protein [Verrucomicrobiota bacterium]|nr:hemolysin family protein [Verrucomicrobiota bacterium]HNT15126.1 hemolysin family protein [Verrucomicrobiota bacterium]
METAEIAALLMIPGWTGMGFFFALSETSLFSLNKWQVRSLAEHQGRRGAQVAQLLEHPQDLLATMVLGNTVANAAILAMGLWLGLAGHWPLWLALGVVLVLVLFVGEVVPKILAVHRPEVWACRIAMPLLVVQRLTQPLHRVAQRVDRAIIAAVVPSHVQPQLALTDADYQELVNFAFQQGNLARSARDIILQIVNLDRHTVKDVMQPRTRLAAIPDDLSIEEMVAAARRFHHRRLPLYDESPDTIVGILNTRTLLLDPNADLADAIEFPSFVPETMNLLHLFKSLQRQGRGMAIVVDEFGSVAGVVTMSDILAELVGKFYREVETPGFVMEKLGAGRWRVNGTMRMDDFRREFPALPDVPGVETMGGWLVHLLGVVPAATESVVVRGLQLTAKTVDDRRVRELLVEVTK